jgi:hypothetical protein
MRIWRDVTRLLATITRLWRTGKLSDAQYQWLSQELVGYLATH